MICGQSDCVPGRFGGNSDTGYIHYNFIEYSVQGIMADYIKKLYETIGMFEGVYERKAHINYEGGMSTQRTLVRVMDEDTLIILQNILASDPKDNVWKGLTKTAGSFKIWAVPADLPEGKRNYRIADIGIIKDLNWQRKRYDAVINIKLEVVD